MQIHELEFLLQSCGNWLFKSLYLFKLDSDNKHEEDIKISIELIKKEKKHELDKINKHYQDMIEELKTNYKNIDVFNHQGMKVIEEKFRLDVVNIISCVLIPQKK